MLGDGTSELFVGLDAEDESVIGGVAVNCSPKARVVSGHPFGRRMSRVRAGGKGETVVLQISAQIGSDFGGV